MGQWPCRCTSTGKYGFTKLMMEWIGPAVVELECRQEFGCPVGLPRRARWINDHAVAHIQAKMVLQNIRWANPFNGCGVTASVRIWVANTGLKGQWPCRCTPIGQDSCIELKMEQISPAVVELQCLQHRQVDGRIDGRRLFCSPIYFLSERQGTKITLQRLEYTVKPG